jgi:lipopolysaccharide assembly outer membrane protein LptD (OstA)
MISPFIDFNYESSFAQQIASRIISPFGFIRNDELKFGIIQHLIKKTQDSSEEFLTLGISQKYYFDPSTSEIKRYYPIELDRNLSPVNIYLRYYPKGRFNLDISADFNTYEKNFLSFNLNSSYGAPEDNIYISLNWSKSYMMFGSNSFFYSNQIGLKTHFRWPEKFELSGEIQRDLQRKKQIYTGIAATYHYQCLDFSFDLRIYYYRAKPETQFRFSIGLGNISKSTSLLGTFGF